jgi:hypothetical protein
MIFKHNTSWNIGALNKNLEAFGEDLAYNLNIERQGHGVSYHHTQKEIGNNSLLGEE